MQSDELGDAHTFGKSVLRSRRPEPDSHRKIIGLRVGSQHKLGGAPNLTMSGPGVVPDAARQSSRA